MGTSYGKVGETFVLLNNPLIKFTNDVCTGPSVASRTPTIKINATIATAVIMIPLYSSKITFILLPSFLKLKYIYNESSSQSALRVLSFNNVRSAIPVMAYKNRFQVIHKIFFTVLKNISPISISSSWLQFLYFSCKNASYNINFSFFSFLFFKLTTLCLCFITLNFAFFGLLSKSGKHAFFLFFYFLWQIFSKNIFCVREYRVYRKQIVFNS